VPAADQIFQCLDQRLRRLLPLQRQFLAHQVVRIQRRQRFLRVGQPITDRSGWFTPLRDPDYSVAMMIVLAGGDRLTWPEAIDYSADALRRDAFPNGLPQDIKAA
jgi:hypothetical protein